MARLAPRWRREPFVALTPFGCAGSAGIAFAAVAGPAGGRAPIGVGQTFPGVYRETGTGWVPSVAGLTAQIARSATRLGDGSVVMTGDSTFRQAADGSLGAWWTDGIGIPGAVVPFNNVATDAAGRALAAGGKLYRRGPADPAWTVVPTPDDQVTAVSRLPTAAHPLYLVSQQGATVSASDDDGATWSRSVSPGGDVVAVEPTPSDAATAFAIAVTGPKYRLIVTHDRGATWATLPGVAPFAIGVDPGDAHHLVAMEDMGVVVTHDGGVTWHGMLPDPNPDASGFRGPNAVAFAFDREAPGVLYAGTYWDGIWASADDGLTWGQIPGLAADQAVTSFVSEGAPASAGAKAARTSTWRLYATIGRVGAGFARIDARVRKPTLLGTPHHNGRRTGRIATCTGAAVIGAPSATTWFAGKVQIGKGRRFRLPASAVGLPVRCQVQAATPYATVLRRSASLRPVGRPFPAGGTVLIRGSRHAGGVARCVVVWHGKPRSTGYAWRVAGAIRATGAHVQDPRSRRRRRLTCTATAHNQYGRTARTSAAAKVRA